MAIRLIFFLLVFFNLLVWWLDPFGPAAAGREPQHMAQQLHPEKLHIVREEATEGVPDAPPAPPATAPAAAAGSTPAAAAATLAAH